MKNTSHDTDRSKVFLNPTELETLHNCVYGTRMCIHTGYFKTTNPKTNEAYGKE